MKRLACPLLLLSALGSASAASPLVLQAEGDWELAPHQRGNVYAPEIAADGPLLRLYYGGQGTDGHDRILLAEKQESGSWSRRGVVFSREDFNHVNDPSVVRAGDCWHLFYTGAREGVTDAIGLATSPDGVKWKDQGIVFSPPAPPAWDSLSVGRPSVWHDGRRFWLWYDGRATLPTTSPDPTAPKSDHSRRSVGLAWSVDGKTWTRHPEPVFEDDAGAVHVRRVDEHFIMVYESREGTRWALSSDGIRWHALGLLLGKSAAEEDRHGHVTPFLHLQDGRWSLWVGGARSPHGDENSILRFPLDDFPCRVKKAAESLNINN